MELLELAASERGVAIPGIYVVDDDGNHVIGGPFNEAGEALAWIEKTHPARAADARAAQWATAMATLPLTRNSLGGGRSRP